MNKIHEECGVFGVWSPERYDVARTCYYGLFSLQHRGQESAGIVVNDDGVFTSFKDVGLVSEVFPESRLSQFGPGSLAVGHVRYSTTGSGARLNAQPIVVNHVKGTMAVAHNGNIVNSYELRDELELQGSIFHTTSDTEVISYLITKARLHTSSIEEAVKEAVGRLKGSFSLVIMSPAKIIAVRDPQGFRPLCYGQTDDGRYVVASENCALSAVSAHFIRDIEPGEIVVFDKDGVRSCRDYCGTAPGRMCIFEYIYFARPDSVIDGVSVQEARVKAGRFLAQDYAVDADVVIGVPDSGMLAAMGYAQESGIPYEIGFVKNKYIGRTFIAPGQKQREDLVNIKLNVVKHVVEGKRVVMVDDSMVRGTTASRIVQKLRDAGATEVHMRFSAPPFISACYYGTDIPDSSLLIAANHSMEEMREMIGVDSIGFLKRERLHQMVGLPEGPTPEEPCGYCDSCFSGEYPAGRPSQLGKYRFETRISENE